MTRPNIPRLHVVTDDRVLARSDWPEAAVAVLEAGGSALALHVRGPATPGRRVHDVTSALLDAARPHGAAVVVNDRVDVALALPVAGVQLGERSLPVLEGRRLLGAGRWIGASIHDAERARDAEAQGADYLVVGTLFATPTHPQRPGSGPDILRRVGEASRLPTVAIGGVTPERTSAVRKAGAHGVAVLGGVWHAPDPAAAVRLYLEALG